MARNLVAALAGLGLVSQVLVTGSETARFEAHGLEVVLDPGSRARTHEAAYTSRNGAALEAIARLSSERATVLHVTKDASWPAFHLGFARHSLALYPRTVLWAAPAPRQSAADWHAPLALEPGALREFCREHAVDWVLADGVDPDALGLSGELFRDRELALFPAPR